MSDLIIDENMFCHKFSYGNSRGKFKGAYLNNGELYFIFENIKTLKIEVIKAENCTREM